MSANESFAVVPRPVSSFRAERRFKMTAAGLGALFLLYAVATLLPTPSAPLSLARNIFVLPIPFVAWWAYRRSPPALRRPLLILTAAAVVWIVGAVVLYGYFFAGGGKVPRPPSPADALFLTARLLIIASIVTALQGAIPFRIAALDAAVIVAAGLALGAALIGHRLDDGFTSSTLVTLNGPVLGVVTLMLLASAAVGSWEGLPRSALLLGAGMAALTAGSVIYSFQAVRDAYVDDRWAGLVWAASGVLVCLAARVIILGVDHPVPLGPRAAIPGHPPGANAILLLSLAALALTLGVAFYGYWVGISAVAVVGVIAGAVVGLAMALRAREAIRTAEDAYARLDRALAEAERSHDKLVLANEELQRANVQMKTMQIALAEALNLADERSQGRMREIIEDMGDELASILEEQLRLK